MQAPSLRVANPCKLLSLSKQLVTCFFYLFFGSNDFFANPKDVDCLSHHLWPRERSYLNLNVAHLSKEEIILNQIVLERIRIGCPALRGQERNTQNVCR